MSRSLHVNSAAFYGVILSEPEGVCVEPIACRESKDLTHLSIYATLQAGEVVRLRGIQALNQTHNVLAAPLTMTPYYRQWGGA